MNDKARNEDSAVCMDRPLEKVEFHFLSEVMDFLNMQREGNNMRKIYSGW